jgi:hypothetical protein
MAAELKPESRKSCQCLDHVTKCRSEGNFLGLQSVCPQMKHEVEIVLNECLAKVSENVIISKFPKSSEEEHLKIACVPMDSSDRSIGVNPASSNSKVDFDAKDCQASVQCNTSLTTLMEDLGSSENDLIISQVTSSLTKMVRAMKVAEQKEANLRLQSTSFWQDFEYSYLNQKESKVCPLFNEVRRKRKRYRSPHTSHHLFLTVMMRKQVSVSPLKFW